VQTITGRGAKEKRGPEKKDIQRARKKKEEQANNLLKRENKMKRALARCRSHRDKKETTLLTKEKGRGGKKSLSSLIPDRKGKKGESTARYSEEGGKH